MCIFGQFYQAMKKTIFLFSLFLSSVVLPLSAQHRFGVKAIAILRLEGGIGYTFFTGPDAAGFATTVKGFGSGLGEELNLRQSIEPLLVGTDKINLSIGIGNSINKYRFADNLVPSLSDAGIVSFSPDPDTTHYYQNTFFGYTKTKLVTSTLYMPFNLNIIPHEEWQFTLGGFIDWLFFAKYKMKYLFHGLQVKELVKPGEMLTLPFNRYRFGIHAGIYYKKLGLGMAGTWYITPTFKAGLGPQVHECRVTVQYDILDLTNLK